MLAGLALFASLLTGCSGGSPYASFDPDGPCTSDGRFPGAYPDLEARVPSRFEGRSPDTLDSGRNCSAAELGTLQRHGIRELRYAGGTWQLGSNAGITLAVFTADGLTAAFLGEWYEATARQARNTRNITPSRPTMSGHPTFRLDTVNNESNQTVITWDGGTTDEVFVVVAAEAGDTRTEAAVAAFP